jgi:hypothetical protein
MWNSHVTDFSWSSGSRDIHGRHWNRGMNTGCGRMGMPNPNKPPSFLGVAGSLAIMSLTE